MKCSICKQKIDPDENGWSEGHNAQPINDGRCCEVCNRIVTSARLTEFFRRGE